MVKMGILKSISARGKIKVFSEFIHDVIDGGEKLIVFAYLKEVVMELKNHFPDAVTVTGDDNAVQKQNAVDRFQNDPECKLIILNYKSGGTGLTLTAASRVAFIEFPWTFSDCEQAEDRAHRNGQKNNVNCYYYLGKDTIDRYMYDVIQTKKNIANGVTGTDDVVKESVVDMAMNLFSQNYEKANYTTIRKPDSARLPDMVQASVPESGFASFAVPNGGRRDAKTGARMKYEGVVRGVADLILLIPKKDMLPSVLK